VQSITTFSTGGQSVNAELFTPAAPAVSTGLIIIAHGTDGMTDNLTGPWATTLRNYALELALKGFVVLIPDYFAATRTPPGAIAAASILQNRDVWQQTLADALAQGTRLSGVDGSRVGLLGFSLGGHLCLRLRASAKVLVEFFAPVFPELGGLGVCGSLRLEAQIHHGEADELVPASFNAIPIRDDLLASGATTALFTYPNAGHGFVGSDPDNSYARDRSKSRTLQCFAEHL
jgi:carboxymethylenebutenolidase